MESVFAIRAFTQINPAQLVELYNILDAGAWS